MRLLSFQSCGILAALVICLAPACAFAKQIAGVQNFQIIKRLTGTVNANNTPAVGIGGTDLGHMVNHNGKTYFLFGDTFSGDTPTQGGNWRHNVMAWSTDTTPANGITFDDWLKSGSTARQVITSGIGSPVTEIPTGAISVNNKIYAWYMAVNQWGDPGQWTLNRAGLARWQEGDSAFTNVNGFDFAGNGNFGMVAASQRSPLENSSDDHVYVWGTPSGRFGGVKLARTTPAQIENRASYEFFNGIVASQPTWTSNEFDADLIVDSPVGEMSVMYNPAVQVWTMLSFNEVSDTFEIRYADLPWGNWSDPLLVATAAQAPGGLYAPYMNPLYTENNGQTIYFTMSIWATYDVYLAKATLNIVPEPAGLFALSVLALLARRRRRVAGDVRAQYVWSGGYVDDLIVRDRDADEDEETGDWGVEDSGLEERLYAIQDANNNVVMLADVDATAVERYAYDPYGEVIVMDDDWIPQTYNLSAYHWEYLFQGGRKLEAGGYEFRNRVYRGDGRWMQQDPNPAGRYADGMNLYLALSANPINFQDAFGFESDIFGIADPKDLTLKNELPFDKLPFWKNPIYDLTLCPRNPKVTLDLNLNGKFTPDNVTVAGGPGITMTTSGGTISISATSTGIIDYNGNLDYISSGFGFSWTSWNKACRVNVGVRTLENGDTQTNAFVGFQF